MACERVADLRAQTAAVGDRETVVPGPLPEGRGVRVGDSERDVKRAYPNARSDTHRGHTHYFIEDDYDRIFVKVVDGVVVALEAHPFEWC